MNFGIYPLSRTHFALLWGIALGVCSVGPCFAAIEIVTTDGRALTGEIDTRSDSRTLWIRYEEAGIILTTAVPWEDVATSRLDGEPIAAAEITSQVSHLKTSNPDGFLTEYEVFSPESQVIADSAPAYFPRTRVMSVEIDARLANLDRTVEPDGIVLAVAPIDAHGQIVPLCGNITVRLLGELFDQHTGRASFLELERWNATVVESMFVENLAEIKLRFRKVRPEFDLGLCTSALVHVRLGVPGTGNFEASIPMDLRKFNPYREQLQYQEGSRFFSNELTHNTRQVGFPPFSRGFAQSSRGW